VFSDQDFHQLRSSINLDIAAITLAAHGEIITGGRWRRLRISHVAVDSGVFIRRLHPTAYVTVSGPFPTMTVTPDVPKLPVGFLGAALEIEGPRLSRCAPNIAFRDRAGDSTDG
jgi:hypothetical protein